MGIRMKIRRRYGQYSDNYKRIADFILKDTRKFIKFTASESAHHCGVSPASIVRFAQHLDCKGLEELKILLTYDLANADTVKLDTQLDTIIKPNDSIDVLCNKVKALILEETIDLFNHLDKSALSKAIGRVVNAKRVFIYGVGSSSKPALDLFHKLKRIGFNVEYSIDIHQCVEYANYATKEDVAIAFCYSGLSREIIYPCQIIKERKGKVISVTRDRDSILKEMSDIVLTVPDSENLTRVGAISSKYNMMEIADLLYLGVLQSKPDMFSKELLSTHMLTMELKKF